jgi:hypothetical protein
VIGFVAKSGASGTPVELPTAFFGEFRGLPAKLTQILSTASAVLSHFPGRT